MSSDQQTAIERAAHAIAQADAVLVTAGAGMGVDSGLPDFRGNQGFWRAYPAYQHLGLDFADMANPRWFEEDPAFAWGFYGHRMQLYRDTVPHQGFRLLRELSGDRPSFAFTSNVDGHFQVAGWGEDQVFEVHGSIHWLQCSDPCRSMVWDGRAVRVDVDPETFRARGPLPSCSFCGRTARPNILMFGDWGFLDDRSERQAGRFAQWLEHVRGGALVVVEMGAGTAIPTVRRQGERLMRGQGATLIRINPREAFGPPGSIGLSMGALEALTAIAGQR